MDLREARQYEHAKGIPALPVWDRFDGHSFAELYGFDSTVIHLPRYPGYEPGELRSWDFDYFYLRSSRYRSCQSCRFLLFGGGLITLADTAAVDLFQDVSDYWSGYFREHFPSPGSEVVHYSGEYGYREFIASNPRYAVLTPHPYDSSHIPMERNYLRDPGLVVRLNDKGRMDELTHHLVLSENLLPDLFAADDWRERWPLPFVVKITEASGGGDGVVLCDSESKLAEARERFAGRMVKVEQWIHGIRNNFNVQLRVSERGEVSFIGGSVQKIEDGRYGGNVIDPSWEPPDPVVTVCDQAAKAAADMGWYGVCGLDIIENEEGELFLIDPNFRLNGSTPFFLLGDYLNSRLRLPQLSTGYLCYPGTPVEFFERFKRDIHLRRLVPIGVHYEQGGDGNTRIYAALVSDGDPEELEYLAAEFEQRSLKPGIHL